MFNIIFYILLSIFTYRLLRYLTTPILKKFGLYKYYSPMFFIFPLTRNVYDIHLGTSWDFFKLKNVNPKLLLKYLAQGLVNLCDDIEKGVMPINKVFRGNTHYLNEKTVNKFGFKTRKMTPIEIFLFSLNYLELCFLQSISLKKISIVSLSSIRILTIDASDLLKNKTRYQEYLNKLKIINEQVSLTAA